MDDLSTASAVVIFRVLKFKISRHHSLALQKLYEIEQTNFSNHGLFVYPSLNWLLLVRILSPESDSNHRIQFKRFPIRFWFQP